MTVRSPSPVHEVPTNQCHNATVPAKRASYQCKDDVRGVRPMVKVAEALSPVSTPLKFIERGPDNIPGTMHQTHTFTIHDDPISSEVTGTEGTPDNKSDGPCINDRCRE
ncbi:hypothetical protein VKT23_013629 [Stygiomarasmius scandens]|uniref:Uncharacterized protein n=1 Tax=Marasmiellus scandens TaxID=2682957 RepID=A0ABR1J5I6_9AGAR